MKNFRVKFIGTLLIVVVTVLSFASYGIFKFQI